MPVTYNSAWHQLFGEQTRESARRILPPILDLFACRSLVEVGCGQAHWSEAAGSHGIAEVLALDGQWNDATRLRIPREAYREIDLGGPLELGRRFDIAVCLEVAEHVAASSAPTLVRSLAGLSDIVLFGAAIPLQGGYGHINEQWPSYWRDLFAEAGYRAFDLVRPAHWTDREIHYWYRQNSFVYVSEEAETAIARAQGAAEQASIALFDAVHPEKFEEVASYRSLALKRLVRRLPGWTMTRLRQKLGGIG